MTYSAYPSQPDPPTTITTIGEHHTMFCFEWTEERVEELKKLYAEGYSASQIAHMMGGLSRNAIIGKAHRLKLESPRKKKQSSVPRAPRDPKAPRAPREPKRHIPTDRYIVFRTGRTDAVLPSLHCVEVEPLNISLEQLERNDGRCRWPYDGKDGPTIYCGHPSLEGKPYCGPHCAKSYLPDNPRNRSMFLAERVIGSGFAGKVVAA